MPIGQPERNDSATPILDSVLAQIPHQQLELTVRMTFKAVTDAKDRLSEKITAGTLTQNDIENELRRLPNLSGIEQGQNELVRFVQWSIPGSDITTLPTE